MYVLIFLVVFSFFHNKLVSKRGLIRERFDLLNNGNDEIRYSVFGLQHQIFAMVGKDAGCAHADGFG